MQTNHLRNPTVLRVGLASQIDKVNIQAQDLGSGRFQMFRLLGIAFDLVDIARWDIVGIIVFGKKLLHPRREIKAGHLVDSDIYVMALLSDQLVADPPTGKAQYERLVVFRAAGIDLGGNIDKEFADSLLFGGQNDCGGGDRGGGHGGGQGCDGGVTTTAFSCTLVRVVQR